MVSLPLFRWRQPVAVDSSDDCERPPTRYDVYRLTPIAAPAQVFRKEQDGCSEPQSIEGVYHQLGERLPPERFVSANTVLRTTEAGLGIAELRAEDGTREVTAIYDFTRDHACVGQETGEAGFRCLGEAGYADDSWFADETCTTQALAWSHLVSCNRTPPSYGLVREFDAETSTTVTRGLVELGERVTSATVYNGSAGCTPTEPADRPHWEIYTIVGPADATELPPLQSVMYGEGQIRLSYLTDREGVVLHLASGSPFYDEGRQQACTPARIVAGGYRCLPEFGFVNEERYRDPACTDRVLAWSSPTVPELLAFGDRSTCHARYTDEVERLVRAGAPYDGPLYYWAGHLEECLPAESDDASAYFEVGESALEEFPALIEPSSD